jgi:tight adherence protein B
MNVFIGQFILMFLVSICVIEMFIYSYRSLHVLNRKKIRKKIDNFSSPQLNGKNPDILKRRVLSNVPALHKMLLRIPLVQRLERLIQQANVSSPPGVFLLLSGVLALLGFYVSSLTINIFIISAVVALLLAAIPFFYLIVKKKQRLQKFEKQLPEGLEFIARAMRAGHAFTGGMKLAADNFDDPLGTEFGRVLNEINFGVNVTDALKNLVYRVDHPDLKYFAVSVILQRETGGNLAEIMESIARIIRERFKFKDKVRVLSAEGKMSAIILVCIPFGVAIALYFSNPKYLTILTEQYAGKVMLCAAGLSMLVGIFAMTRIIKIEV